MEKGVADRGKTRIYVGGLGDTVTAEDLKKTFTSPQLGDVQSADLIRTKGRSFAYLDFVPSSDHSLLKLFSKYNGCMWKGGRLRLEKAKEHFLQHLKREWAEDAEVASDSACPLPSATTGSLDKPKKNPNLEKMQLDIYFPKLRKIRSLPIKGTGKHKYSFQRVEVPSFPIHFCDCEEHSGSAYTPKEKPSIEKEIEMGGVDEEELNIMASVMNKIFERENRSETAFRHGEFSNEVQNLTNVADDSMVEEDDDGDDDNDDGIIINVVTRKNGRISSLHDISKRTVTHNQKSLHMVKHGDPKMIASRKRKVPPIDNLSAINDGRRDFYPPDGDATPRHIEAEPCIQQSNCKVSLQQSARGEPADMIAETADVVVDNTLGKKRQRHQSRKEFQSKFNGVPMSSFTDEKDEEKLEQHDALEKIGEASSSKENASMDKSARGASWLQTSSWTQLVGDMRNSCFSISQILPNLKFESQDQRGTDSSQGHLSKMWGGTFVDHSTAPGSSTERPLEEKKNNVRLGQGESKLDNTQKEDRVNAEEKKLPSTSKQMPLPEVSIGETCSFTRNATSMKEWMRAKAALSGSLKKDK